MGKVLIHRPQGMGYTMLREELLRFCDGDACAALILHILESRTANRLAEMEHSDAVDGLLWIQISVEKLRGDMLNQYSDKPIRNALKTLEKVGAIVVAKQDGPQAAKAMILNYQMIDRCVTLGYTTGLLESGQVTLEPLGKITERSVKLPEFSGRITGPNKEVQDQDQDREHAVDSDRATHTQNTEEEDRPPKKSWPGFRKKQKPPPDPNSQSERLRRMRENGATEPVVESGVSNHVVPASSLPTPSVTPNYATRWNELVPEKKTNDKLRITPHAYRDPDFQANFEEICQKARELITASAIAADYISFGKVVTKDPKSGVYNFVPLLNGEWDWMVNKDKNPKEIYYPKFED